MNEQDIVNSVKGRWNVFIPRDLLTKPPGRLTGYIDCDAGLICVLGLWTATHNKDTASVGYWHGSNRNSFETETLRPSTHNFQKRHAKFKLHLMQESNKISCFRGDNVKVRHDESTMCVCVFDPADILSSYLISRPEMYESAMKESFEIKNRTKPAVPDVLGERIGHAIQRFQLEEIHRGEHLLFKRNSSSLCTRLPREAACVIPRLVMTILSYVHFIFNSSPPLVKKVLCVPSLSERLMERCKRSSNVLRLDQEQPFNKFVLYNTYAQYSLESLIGVCVLYYVTAHDVSDRLASSVLDWADDVASRSKDLIEWLMGAPAGLKLNAQLTSMLGHFFIYHIYLWTGYLTVLRTVLPWLLHIASWTGLLGVSFQLCVVKDIVSMLTVHIYCFYVYAARIFNLQVSALSSMWRLFRGKKWNTLRSRVDSAAYNTDQLFVGTLLFTVLLFLLPTTALYYAVFTGLRVITLTFQTVLTRVIQVISLTPVYSLVLCVVRPGWIAGRVEFEPVCLDTPPANMVLSLKTTQLPLSEVISLTTPYLNETTSRSHSWSNFLSCIASGRILYPWMEGMGDDGDEGKDGAKTGGGKAKAE